MTSKWILHIDFDSFFASVEQQTNPLLRGKPVGVTGTRDPKVQTGIIVAASKEAKKIGIKTGLSIKEAKRKYPAFLTTIPHFDKYSTVHKQWNAILKPFSPKVEIFSIDEAFLDITHWVETWEYTPERVGKLVKKAIRKGLGTVITASVGIAQNKTMAKLATGFGKPDGLTVFRKTDYADALKSVSAEELCGIGRRLGARLAALGAVTAYEVGELPEKLLRAHFGIYGLRLHEMGQGILDEPLITDTAFPKSIGHTRVLAPNLSLQELDFTLRELCEMVAYRARKHNVKGKTLSAGTSDEEFHRFGHSLQLDQYTSDGFTLYREAKTLLGPGYKANARFLGVTLSSLLHKNAISLSFFQNDSRLLQAQLAMDHLTQKFGNSVMHFGAPSAKLNMQNEMGTA